MGSEHGLDGENILGRCVSGDARGPLGIPGHASAGRTQVNDDDDTRRICVVVVVVPVYGKVAGFLSRLKTCFPTVNF